MNEDFVIDDAARQLLKDTISPDQNKANAAKLKLGYDLAIALSLPLKQGILYGDTISGIYSQERFEPGVPVEYPLDFLTPTSVGRHIAYVVPHTGYIPQRTIEGTFITVKTFDIATAIDWSRKYPLYARWDVVGRAMQVAEASLVRKRNNDGWHTILAAAVGRGLQVYDNAAAVGLFTKRLVTLAQITMRRSAGGNSTSVNRGRLTHIALSPEGINDVRTWDATQVDEFTRRDIYLAGEGSATLTKVFGVTLVDLDELGIGQEYQNYYTNTLGATMSGSKTEVMVGLDLMHGALDSFLMPWIVQPNGEMVEMLQDPTLIRENRDGYFGRMTYGCSVLDDRRVLVLVY